MHSQYSRGLSLIECCSVLSILSIVATSAAPTFSGIIAKHKIRTVELALRNSLSFARQKAISSTKSIYLCASKDSIQCDVNRPFNANWSHGWLTFIDINDNKELDAPDELLTNYITQEKVGVVFNQRGRIRFKTNGSARSAGYYICNKTTAKHIRVLYSGRTRSNILEDKNRLATCLRNIP